MNRRQAIAKAIETTDLDGGALDAEQARTFIEDIQSQTPFSEKIRIERRTAATGSISKVGNDSRIIRRSEENSDDGYRAGLNFPEKAYSAQGIRLPFEITLDALHENIEGDRLEAIAEKRMARQFEIDLHDLGFNGLGSAADPVDPDYEFLRIDEGWIKLHADNAPAANVIDGSTINGGAISKDHLFAATEAISEDVADAFEDELIWIGRRSQHLNYLEGLAARATNAGDAVLLEGSPAGKSPLGHDYVRVGKIPADTVLFTVPENLVRVITWEVLHFRVGPETDKELAARKAVFHIWHVKVDHLVMDYDRTVQIHSLDT